MPEFERHPKNVDGSWYVDTSCLNCSTCFELAPDLFRNEFKELGQTIVSQQPVTDAEEALMREAGRKCCMGAIKDSGDNQRQIMRSPESESKPGSSD